MVQRNKPRDAFKIVSRFTGKKRIIMNVLFTLCYILKQGQVPAFS